jgi:hypothetical protein
LLVRTIQVHKEPEPPPYVPWKAEWERQKANREEARAGGAKPPFQMKAMLEIHNKLPPPTPNIRSKAYFTEWIKTIPYRRGHYLVPIGCTAPYEQKHFVQVVQIQEVHLFLQFDENGQPLPMEVCDSIGNRWDTSVLLWKRVPCKPSFQFHLPPE